MPPHDNPDLLLGFETKEDAAVYRLRDDLAAVLTVDYFTPMVDDPFEFGCVAAANALSDIYAMGAQPHIALNLLSLDSELGTDLASKIISGGQSKALEAGVITTGGHTIEDSEPKYGMCVFGTVHPDKIISNSNAQPGDYLYLTKPIGTGIMSAAHKIGEIDDKAMQKVINSMMELNRAGGEAMCAAHANAATDVTGFGLAGHLHEMLQASSCCARLDWDALPVFPEVEKLARMYCLPSRLFNIVDYMEPFLKIEGNNEENIDCRRHILCDPQTSGGLLISISPDNAQDFENVFAKRAGRQPTRIGTIEQGNPGIIFVPCKA